jgi:hypothetical protein
MNETFMVEVGEQQYLLKVAEGKVAVEKGPFVQRTWRFADRAKQEAWEKFWQKTPAPGWHDLFGLLRRGDGRVRRRPARADGLPAIREAGAGGAEEGMKLEQITGKYGEFDFQKKKFRLYFEERAAAFRCCACTPPARTGGSTARC